MADNWDDSDDEWDVDDDDDELDARLGLKKLSTDAPVFDDDEDLTVKQKAEAEKNQHTELKKKGNALAARKKVEQERMEEEELARKAMEMEAKLEASLSPDELAALKRKQIEEADHELTDDLFGGADAGPKGHAVGAAAGDTVVMKDLKDHLKHARKVGQCIKGHGNIHLATAFIKEVIEDCKDVLDDDAITDIVKICNAIKNEKVAASKRKIKGQAQKAKKDKAAEAKAKKLQVELYGDNDYVDQYEDFGADYEDAFF